MASFNVDSKRSHNNYKININNFRNKENNNNNKNNNFFIINIIFTFVYIY